MPTYALLGYPLSHSFSQTYFTAKFEQLGLTSTHRYLNFSLENVLQIKKKLEEYNDLAGFNVTIPHKRAIIPLLDALDPVARQIGAVNTVVINKGKLTGFNTDYLGFRDDFLLQLAQSGRSTTIAGKSALILGTGGASLGIREAFRQMGVPYTMVSRSPGANTLTYTDLTPGVIAARHFVVNTTPLGTSPNVDTFPDIPYASLTEAHFCYDLVYNPPVTAFMRKAMGAGAGAASGLGMLHKQAEAAWAIWQAHS